MLSWIKAAPANVRASLWMIAAAVVFSNMSGLVKFLGQDLHGFEIAFLRSIFGFLVLIPALHALGGLKAFQTQRPGLHLARCILGGVTMLCFFYSMTELPLANAKTLSFSQPLFMLLLAPFFLNEKIGWHRGFAAVIGFTGLIIAAQPGSLQYTDASFAAITGAVTMACAMIIVKKLSATEKPVTILAYFALAAIVVTAIPTYFVWKTPTWTQVGLSAVIGGMASFGQYLYIRAYKIGEASVVAPLSFLQIPFSGFVGYMAFAEVPTQATVIGGIIIVSSAIYITRREAMVKKKEVTKVQTNPA